MNINCFSNSEKNNDDRVATFGVLVEISKRFDTNRRKLGYKPTNLAIIEQRYTFLVMKMG